MRKQEYINLHLGAGKRNIPGFINVDLSNYKHIHFKRNVSNLKNFKTNSVDYIYASHVLEYFDYNDNEYKVFDFINNQTVTASMDSIKINIGSLIQKYINNDFDYSGLKMSVSNEDYNFNNLSIIYNENDTRFNPRLEIFYSE